MRALITGITGFIGTHVGELLRSHGDAVLGVGRSGKWKSDAPCQLVEETTLLPWDIARPADPTLLQKVNEFAPDVVFHFAGMSIPSQCGRDEPSPQAISVNVQGTRHVLELARQLQSEPKFIFASTVHVYAHVKKSAPYVTELSAIDPVSAYGQTKRDCELAILQQIEAGSLRACIARGFHHIGLRQPEGLMLTDWLGQLRDPNCVNLQVRSTNSYLDLIDVRDAARAYLLLAQDDTASGIYNLGSGKITRSGDVLQAILTLFDRTVSVVEGSSLEQWNAIADIQKLSALGWETEFGYPETIAAMISNPKRSK